MLSKLLYSAHRSPIKSTTSSLLISRNQTNEVLSELKQNENPLIRIRKELTVSKTTTTLLEDKNTAL